MSFDEQLRRAFDTLNDHLRDELTRQMAAVTDELRKSAALEREQAVTTLRAEHDEALAAADEHRATIVATAARERDEAIAAARREHEEALADLVREREAALAAAVHEREEALAAAAREHDQALAAAARERDEALADAVHQREEALAAAIRERDEALAAVNELNRVMADAARTHEEALEVARAEAAAAAAQQAHADAARDGDERLAHATAEAESRTRQQVEEEANARIAELHAQLRDAEQVARDAQGQSRRAIEQAAAEARADARPADANGLERLLDGVRAIDRARSLSEILDTLVGCAGREATRAGMLLVRGGELRGWRFIGFDGGLDRDAAIRFDDAGIVAVAAKRSQVCQADRASSDAPRFAAAAGAGKAVAVPLALAGQTVAVLYADRASDATGDGRWIESIELLARHATRALEGMTAFKAARALVQNLGAHADASNGTSDDHEAARRYARLLVSEIKMYHEADVVAGRREHDLATRLAGEIERARTLYCERVAPSIRSGNDYFHAELVRTLADGDPSLLGEVKL